MPIGDGETLSLGAQTNGSYYQSYNIGYSTAWLGGKRPLQFSVNAFFSKQTDVSTSYINSSYMSTIYGMYGIDYMSNMDPDKSMKMFGASLY